MAGLRALIVDDSPTLRQGVIRALEGIPDLVCIEAADGAEGIRRLTDQAVDLIVTDLQMPVMNGFSFIQFLRQRAATRDIPIVVVTAAGNEDDRRKLAGVGVTAFVRKPFNPVELLSLARGLLQTAGRATS